MQKVINKYIKEFIKTSLSLKNAEGKRHILAEYESAANFINRLAKDILKEYSLEINTNKNLDRDQIRKLYK